MTATTNTARRLTAAVLTATALIIAPAAVAPSVASARPVPEHEMDRSYTGPTGTRAMTPTRCAPRSFVGLNCVVPRLITVVLRFR